MAESHLALSSAPDEEKRKVLEVAYYRCVEVSRARALELEKSKSFDSAMVFWGQAVYCARDYSMLNGHGPGKFLTVVEEFAQRVSQYPTDARRAEPYFTTAERIIDKAREPLAAKSTIK